MVRKKTVEEGNIVDPGGMIGFLQLSEPGFDKKEAILARAEGTSSKIFVQPQFFFRGKNSQML